jgi:hypothetical protein
MIARLTAIAKFHVESLMEINAEGQAKTVKGKEGVLG